MNSEPKIPTLLGLAILIVGLVVGLFAVNRTQIFQAQASPDQVPTNIVVTNISDSSVSLFWQTNAASAGFVTAGINSNLNQTFKDDRDTKSPVGHNLHFVTLTNLTPNTNYNYKISSDGQNFPASENLTFKTTPKFSTSDYQPVIGVVVDANLVPVVEAIVRMEIPGAQSMATVTKTSGNFILPLANLKAESLQTNFKVSSDGVPSVVTISALNQTSHVKLKFPIKQLTLPPVTLGQDYDFTDITSDKPPVLSAQTVNLSSIEMLDKYDFDHDGQINNLDGQLIKQNFKKKSPKFDLDQNGQIDQTDLNLFNDMIARGFSQSAE